MPLPSSCNLPFANRRHSRWKCHIHAQPLHCFLFLLSSSHFPHKFAFLQISFVLGVPPPLLPALDSLDATCPLRVSCPPSAPCALLPAHPLLLGHSSFTHPLSLAFPQTLPFPFISSVPVTSSESSTSPLLRTGHALYKETAKEVTGS